MLRAAQRVADARETAGTRELAEALSSAKRERRAPIHGFHRWYGKLIPAIPAAAIEAFTAPRDLVVDPFCGSGTVLVESRMSGRACVGTDVNPLATLLSRVKTRALEPAALEEAVGRVRRRAERDQAADWAARLPCLPHRDHFYPDSVARDLVRLHAAARRERQVELREYLLALVSAINRDVSNADTRHVFPGVSKRMRALIEQGWIGDVSKRFARAASDWLAWSAHFSARARTAPPAVVADGPASLLPVADRAAALIVTNPPYISSVRYVETFKLEALWLGVAGDTAGLHALDERCLGTERVDRHERVDRDRIDLLPSSCRDVVLDLAGRVPRMAAVVSRYLEGLVPVAREMARVLRRGGHAVVKLAPSRVRGTVVPTPDAMAEVLEAEGLELIGAVDDSYSTSRSLTLSRNWYSGRMDADLLLLFRAGRDP